MQLQLLEIISIGASVLWDSGYILFVVFLVGDAIGLRQMPRVVTSSTFSFIFEACQGTASFWALVSVLVDIFFVSIPAIFRADASMQVLSCAVVALVYLLALLKVKPYVDRSSHYMDVSLTIALLIICLYSAGAGFADPLAKEVTASGGGGRRIYLRAASWTGGGY